MNENKYLKHIIYLIILEKIGIETLDLVKIKKKNSLIFVPNATLFPSVLEVYVKYVQQSTLGQQLFIFR